MNCQKAKCENRKWLGRTCRNSVVLHGKFLRSEAARNVITVAYCRVKGHTKYGDKNWV